MSHSCPHWSGSPDFSINLLGRNHWSALGNVVQNRDLGPTKFTWKLTNLCPTEENLFSSSYCQNMEHFNLSILHCHPGQRQLWKTWSMLLLPAGKSTNAHVLCWLHPPRLHLTESHVTHCIPDSNLTVSSLVWFPLVFRVPTLAIGFLTLHLQTLKYAGTHTAILTLTSLSPPIKKRSVLKLLRKGQKVLTHLDFSWILALVPATGNFNSYFSLA